MNQPDPLSNMNTQPNDRHFQKMQLIMSWIVMIILVGFGVLALYKLTSIHKTSGNFWLQLIQEQFPVIIGLPMAGLGSLFVTLVLRLAHGPLEFEFAGLKFKGGAAPIVFWLLCFLTIVFSIKLLWLPQ